MSKSQIERLDLNLILVFEALLRHSSVTRAAAVLNVTQSGVSHSLSRLRLYFDDPLFTRSSDGIVPTPRALELSKTVLEIATLVREGLLSATPFQLERTVRVFSLCLADLGELAILPMLVRALMANAPGCTLRSLQAQPKEARAMLESGEVDLVIGAIAPGEGEIYRQKLHTNTNIVLAHEQTVTTERIDLDTYCALPHIAVAPILDQPSLVDQALADIDRQRHIVMSTQHYLIVPHLVEAEPALIATISSFMEDACRRHPGLRTLPLPFEMAPMAPCQHWHERLHRDRFHIWIRQLIAAWFQKAAGGEGINADERHSGS
jgi:DNA-binding transcriptional LysR family regulator